MNNYYLLGRSGLRVSRLALGTMNFGTGGFSAAYGKTEAQAEPDAVRTLDAASAPPAAGLYSMFTPEYQSWIVSRGLGIGDKPAGYAPPVFNG